MKNKEMQKKIFPSKRPIIDMKSLKIWRSLTECANELGMSKENCQQHILSNGLILGKWSQWKNGKRSEFKLEYLDVYITEYPDWEKEQIFDDKSVSFFTLD